MKINSVGIAPSFKAQMTPEVKNGLLALTASADKKSYGGRKIERNVSTIMGVMQHVSLSIKKINRRGEESYTFVLKNPVTKREVEVSYSEKEKKDLFTPEHIDNIKWAMYDENRAEINKYAIAAIHSNKIGNQNKVKPYQDVFAVDGIFKEEVF